jgi:predicted transcriptional regulator
MATDYTEQQSPSADATRSLSSTIVARVSSAERSRLSQLADTNDRTLSREVRRAIRWYLAFSETAERVLREQTPKEKP